MLMEGFPTSKMWKRIREEGAMADEEGSHDKDVGTDEDNAQAM